jgi:hypothetical protein
VGAAIKGRRSEVVIPTKAAAGPYFGPLDLSRTTWRISVLRYRPMFCSPNKSRVPRAAFAAVRSSSANTRLATKSDASADFVVALKYARSRPDAQSRDPPEEKHVVALQLG